jgi:proteasome accessory factor B
MSHAVSKRERLEAAEMLLQSSREGLTVFDLSKALNCHFSTAHRYLDEIRQTHTLIEEARGHYRLDPAQALNKVRMHPAEALTIYLALRRFIRQTSKAPDFMISAIQKVVPALQRPDLIDALTDSNTMLRSERSAHAGFTRIWETLIQAWLENRLVHIHYRKAGADEAEEHDIEPYLFEPVPTSDGVYVIAWSRQRQALRTFKVDRIERATLTLQPFEKPLLDVVDLLQCAWGIWYGETPTHIELIFMPAVARRLLESVYLPTETKELLPDGSLRWRAQVSGLLEILSWVRGWGPNVRVVEPAALRNQVVHDLRAALAVYEGG